MVGTRIVSFVCAVLMLSGMLVACGAPAGDAGGDASQPAAAPQDMPTAAPLWTATPGSDSTDQAVQERVVAVVNGTSIHYADFEQQLTQAQTYYLQQPTLDVKTEAGQQALQAFQNQVLGWMIDQLLIEQAAAAAGFQLSDEQLDAQIEQMRAQDATRFQDWLTANGLTEESLRRQLRADLITAAVRDAVTGTLSRKTLQIHARHILLSTEEAAQAALQRLRDGENFIVVAREVSEDEITRESGGDLGFVPQGLMPPAFEQAAFALQPGDISDIVQTDLGLHIIQVIEIDPEHEISDEFWPAIQQQAFGQWLEGQRAQADIQRLLD